MIMASGYNEGCDVEGVRQDVPPKPSYRYEQSGMSPYPEQQASQFPLTQPSEYPSQQPYPNVQPNTTQPPVEQNIVHVTNQTMPNDYFGFALFVTLFCCLPFGMFAIMKSSEVKSLSAAGDYHGAALASVGAKRWATIGLIFGVIGIVAAAVTWAVLSQL